jgi:hypothetical protein
MPLKNEQKLFDPYFFTHRLRNNDIFGLRFAKTNDCDQIINLFIEEYGFKYVDPIVYDRIQLTKKIMDEKDIWIVADDIKNGILIGISHIELKNNIAYAEKVCIKRDYRGNGLSSHFSFNGVQALIHKKILQNYIKIDSDVRASQIGAQKLCESASGIAYSFIPNKFLLSDKREKRLNLNEDQRPNTLIEPFNEIGYFVVLPQLPRKRIQYVYLLDHDLIYFLYNNIKGYRRSMQFLMADDYVERVAHPPNVNSASIDNLIKRPNNLNSYIKIYGLLDSHSIDLFIKSCKSYRLIIWYIPTTIEGTYCMKIAFEKGFKAIGYDMASIESNNIGKFYDAVIFAFYNSIQEKFDFSTVRTTNKNRGLFEVISQQFCD